MMELQEAVAQLPETLFPSGHHFAEGIYVRETFLPAGSIVVGKIHRYSTVNLITLGMVKAFNPEQPENDKIMVAPFTFVSPPGSKRAVFAIQDSIWCTVHQSSSQDLDTLEDEFIVKDYDQLTQEERKCLGAL